MTIEPNPHVALNNARNLPRPRPIVDLHADVWGTAGLDMTGCQCLRSMCCNAKVGVNASSRYECVRCRAACSTVRAVAQEVMSDINTRSQAQGVVDQLRPLLAQLTDSDRFALFRVVTEGYCPECGRDLKGELDCADCAYER